jgi:hypothetical protein
LWDSRGYAEADGVVPYDRPNGQSHVVETHASDGIFTSVGADGQLIRTRISALLVYQRRSLSTPDDQEMVVIHNPYVANVLPLDVVDDPPQSVVNRIERGIVWEDWTRPAPSWAVH